MKRFLAVLAAAMVMGTGAARAEFAVGPNISTLGYGAEVVTRLNNTFILRVEGNYFNFSEATTVDDLTYQGDVNFRSLGAMIDMHPFGNGLMVSGGLYYNGNEIQLTATPASSVTIGPTTYTPAQIGTINGTLDFGTFSPYVGFGYDNTLFTDWRLSLSMRVGVMIMQGATAKFSTTGTLSADPGFQNDLRAEEQKAQDALDRFGFFPVVSIGIRYRF